MPCRKYLYAKCCIPHIEQILQLSSSTQSNTDLPGQACVLHTLVASPTQSLPPFARAGLLHVLVSVPPPQLFEHAPKPDHPPSSVLSPVMPSATQCVRQQCHDSRFFPTPRTHQQTTATCNALSHKTDITAHSRQQAVLAQACMLHALIASPTQSLPPFAGAGLLHIRL